MVGRHPDLERLRKLGISAFLVPILLQLLCSCGEVKPAKPANYNSSPPLFLNKPDSPDDLDSSSDEKKWPCTTVPPKNEDKAWFTCTPIELIWGFLPFPAILIDVTDYMDDPELAISAQITIEGKVYTHHLLSPTVDFDNESVPYPTELLSLMVFETNTHPPRQILPVPLTGNTNCEAFLVTHPFVTFACLESNTGNRQKKERESSRVGGVVTITLLRIPRSESHISTLPIILDKFDVVLPLDWDTVEDWNLSPVDADDIPYRPQSS